MLGARISSARARRRPRTAGGSWQPRIVGSVRDKLLGRTSLSAHSGPVPCGEHPCSGILSCRHYNPISEDATQVSKSVRSRCWKIRKIDWSDRVESKMRKKTRLANLTGARSVERRQALSEKLTMHATAHARNLIALVPRASAALRPTLVIYSTCAPQVVARHAFPVALPGTVVWGG